MSVSTVWKIQSVQTEEYLVPYITNAGDLVVTTPKDSPDNFFVFFGPVSHGRTTTAAIRGQHGLFIHPGPHNRHLILAPVPYEWQVAPVGGNYQFYPAGEDLYWFQSASAKPFIGLSPGKDLVEEEPVFKLIPA